MVKPQILKNSLGVSFILLIATLLYFPFLSNGLVFDDHNVFTNLTIYDHSQVLFDWRPRTFSYFTLGFVEVMSGKIEVHRMVSLILHVLCASMLFLLLKTLLVEALKAFNQGAVSHKQIDIQAFVISLICASWFAIHPVAVYGAGYLVQRTIIFATLFSLLSLWFYRRAFAENRTVDMITAAMFYAAAIFSKEHAIMLPLAALPIAMLYEGNFRSKLARISLYILLCIPSAVAVYLRVKSVVATGYEPYVGDIVQQVGSVSVLENPDGLWMASAAFQAGIFFDYLYYWSVPDIRLLSADMRIDFAHIWTAGWLIPKTILFIMCPVGALYGLRRNARWALFGCGLLYFWLLFMTELSTVRFQEPLVLYRSYLWAPGMAMMLAALLMRTDRRWMLIVFTIAAPLFFAASHERLESLVNEQTVWEDAAAKLSSPDIPGADRIYYNRGGERLKKGELTAAMDDLNKVVALNPNSFHGYLGRGLIYLQIKNYPRALEEFDRVLEIKKNFGFALFRRGLALEGLGQTGEALKAYEAAANAGDALGKLRFTYLKNSSIQVSR